MDIKQSLTNRYDNFVAAMKGEPFCVPIFAQIHDHAAKLAGVSIYDFFTNPKTFVDTTILASEYYQFDFPRLIYDGYNIEAEALGAKIVFPNNAIPDIDRVEPLIKQPGDLAKLTPPDPYSSGRMPFVLDSNRRYVELTGLAPNLTYCAPLSLAIQVRGYTNLITDIYKRPSFVHELLTFLTEQVLIPWINILRKEAGGNLLVLGADAWASPPNFTIEMLEEFDIPYVLKIKEICGTGSASGWWGDCKVKDPQRLIDLKAKVPPGYLYGFDPDPNVLGPEIYKNTALQHNLPLALGIDAGLLCDGPVEILTERIRRYIKIGAPGGKFFILLNSIPAITSPEHIHLAVKAVHTFGKYPIEDFDNNIVSPTLTPAEKWTDFIARVGPLE